MNGRCIIIDYCLGLYSVSIVNMDNTKIERQVERQTRHSAYKCAMEWVADTHLPVRVQHGSLLTMPEKKDIIDYHLEGGAK